MRKAKKKISSSKKRATTKRATPKRNRTQAMADIVAPPTVAAAKESRRRAIGGSGSAIHAGLLDDNDHNAEVRGEYWTGSPGVLGIADKMIRDAHVRRSMDAITKPLRAALWDIAPASDSEIDVEIADFVRWNLFERLDFDSILRVALTHLRYGFSFFEVLDDVEKIPAGRFKNHAGNGFGVVLKAFEHRPSWSISRWHTQKNNGAKLEAVEQYLSGGDNEPSGFVRIPIDRMLRFTCEQEGNNYAGLSVLRSAYGAWKTKLTYMVLEAIRHERQGVGTPTMTLPESAGDDEVDAAEIILAEMRAHEKGYLVLPHGYEFRWSTTDGSGTNIAESIERCNRDIAFNVAAGFMLLGISGDSGSFALAQTQEGQYQITLDAEARYIGNVFRNGSDGWSPIRRIVEMNYGPDYALPHLVARNMPTRNWANVMPVVHNLIMSRGIVPDARLRAHIRESLMLPAEDAKTRDPVDHGGAGGGEYATPQELKGGAVPVGAQRQRQQQQQQQEEQKP